MIKRFIVGLLFVASTMFAQTGSVTTDSSGNVIKPAAVNFPTPIPLKLNGVTINALPGNSKYWGTNGSGTFGYYDVSAGTPGGSDTQVQFNDSSAFGGDADFTWNKTTNVITLAGTQSINTGTITSSKPAIDITQTWNNAASFTGIKLNITNTNSGGLSRLLDLQVGSVSKFNVNKLGGVTAGPSIFTMSDSQSDSVGQGLIFNHHLSSGTVASGFGTGMQWLLDDTTGTDQNAGDLNVVWSDATHATHSSYMDFMLANAGIGTVSVMRLFGDGGLSVNSTTDPGAGYVNVSTGYKVNNVVVLSGPIVGGFTAHFSRGGAVIQANDTTITPWTCPYSGTITGYSISADTGTCTLKTWKKANGTAIPTIADVISTSGVALSSGTHIRSSTVSDFTTTAVTAGDMFMAQVTAVSGATDITFQVEITR